MNASVSVNCCGTARVAVLMRAPVAPGAMVASMVKVTDEPAARVRESEMSVVPLDTEAEALPVVPVSAQVAEVMADGRVSLRFRFATVLCELSLATTRV